MPCNGSWLAAARDRTSKGGPTNGGLPASTAARDLRGVGPHRGGGPPEADAMVVELPIARGKEARAPVNRGLDERASPAEWFAREELRG